MMRIPLVDEWEAKIKFNARVHKSGPRDQKVVDDAFDKLHSQGKMEWAAGPTPDRKYGRANSTNHTCNTYGKSFIVRGTKLIYQDLQDIA